MQESLIALLQATLIGDGYVRLGVSDWQDSNDAGGGVPQKDMALAYARAIGADVVIYADFEAENRYNASEHWVGFYAKPSVRAASSTRPSGASAKELLNRFQDVHGRPRVQSDVVYDPRTDTYTWIGPVTGKRITKTSSVFLSDIGL